MAFFAVAASGVICRPEVLGMAGELINLVNLLRIQTLILNCGASAGP